MTIPISIIIPAFNQLDYCRQCVESLQANTDRSYELILVDNGSTDGVSEYFDTIENARVLHSEKNLGFAGAVNLGMDHAGDGHILLLNSDTVLPRGWLVRLERGLLSDDSIGMVGPRSNYAATQYIDELDMDSPSECDAYAQERARTHAGQLTATYRLTGFCLLIRDSVFKEVGNFDESYRVGCFEDFDYCLRVNQAGYKIRIVENAFVFHYGNRTFKGMGLEGDSFTKIVCENEALFFSKWGYEALKHSDVAIESQRLNEKAKAAMKSEKFTEAMDYFLQAIKTFPLLATNYNDLGVLLSKMGHVDHAYSTFEKAVRFDPSFEEAQQNLLDTAEALNREQEAAAAILDAKNNPKQFKLR